MTHNITPPLPEDKEAALDMIINLTSKAIEASENETNLWALGRTVEFIEASQVKQDINNRYMHAIAEFKIRWPTALNFNQDRISELARLQKSLKQACLINMSLFNADKK